MVKAFSAVFRSPPMQLARTNKKTTDAKQVAF